MGCDVTAHVCGLIAVALATAPLTELDLGANPFGDEGAWSLAWALPAPGRLRWLGLSNCEVSADGADELLEALRAMPMPSPMPARDGLYGPVVQLLDMRGNRVPEAHELADDPRVNLAFQRPQLAQP
jgi:hypothetical protein